MDRALQKNIRTIYCMTFFQSAMVVSAVFVPLLQRYGLTMSQVMQTQAIFALVVAALEVPSGYLADLWGRKHVILLGQGLMLSAFAWLVFADSFADFIVYESVMGAGISLCSGSDLALLYDSQAALRERGDQSGVDGANHIARLVAIESYSNAIAAILASVLTLQSFDWVLLVQCGCALVAFGFALSLREVNRRITLETHKDNFTRIAKTVIGQPLVMWTSVAIITFGLASLLGFWLIQKYWESQSVPVYLFGYIWAAHGIVRGLSANGARWLEDTLGWQKVFVLVAFLPILGFIGLSLLGGWSGILFGLLLPISRGLNMVIFYDALNRRVDSTFRATVNSVVSLGTRVLFIVGGPLLGYLVDIKGVNFSFMALAGVCLPLYFLVLAAVGRNIVRERGVKPDTAVG